MVLKFKKIVAAAGVAALAMSMSGKFALATSSASAEVVGDGDAYTNTDDSDELEVENTQDAWVANLDLGIGVSGANTQDGSDDENSMTTGDSDGTGQSDNFLNSNVSMIEDVDWDSSTAESTVGEDGDATSEAYDNDDIDVYNYNEAGLENFTLGLAVSGYNSQSGNDDGNSTETGESNAMAKALNEINSNWTVIGGGHSAHTTSTVGDDGDAYAYSEDNDEVEVSNNNAASLSNASIAFAFSGGNNQSYNDDDNILTAGPSSAQSSASNFVNSNVTVVGGEEGNGSATSTSKVGEDGDATSEAYDNDSIVVGNSNSAKVENVSVAAGVSGYNNQSNNDDGNTMTTGNSSGNSCSSNTVNSNWTVIGGSLPEGEAQGCALH